MNWGKCEAWYLWEQEKNLKKGEHWYLTYCCCFATFRYPPLALHLCSVLCKKDLFSNIHTLEYSAFLFPRDLLYCAWLQTKTRGVNSVYPHPQSHATSTVRTAKWYPLQMFLREKLERPELKLLDHRVKFIMIAIVFTEEIVLQNKRKI